MAACVTLVLLSPSLGAGWMVQIMHVSCYLAPCSCDRPTQLGVSAGEIRAGVIYVKPLCCHTLVHHEYMVGVYVIKFHC